MKPIAIILCLGLVLPACFGQQPLPPDKIFGQLFNDVQTSGIFADGKTFVDCVPKRDPATIVSDYRKIKANPAIRFSLKFFVKENFLLPVNPATAYRTDSSEDLTMHIRNLWKVLKRDADKNVRGSSLLPLPYAYIVPGGRFREIYYWDSYFTMLGLQQSKEFELMENMIKNFAYLINNYGHIPNGNRTYYLSRSQPPFFSLMVGLLAEVKGDQVYQTYGATMEKEYDYWMEGTARLKSGEAHRRVVKLKDGTIMNRYWDDSDRPRQESYSQDVETTLKSGRDKTTMYHHLRAGAESGWDFSSRWFENAKNMGTIQVTDIIPIDLNCLLYGLETAIAKAKLMNNEKKLSDEFLKKAASRKNAVLKYCWNPAIDFFSDYNFKNSAIDTNITAAGLFPLFMKIATDSQAKKITIKTSGTLVKAGGIVTTTVITGQQWDAPNGWAPLQWVTVKGLNNYGFTEIAGDIALRWISINEKVFRSTGKMMEKYNVIDTELEAGGGEYGGQDGFGWTNGVYLQLKTMYGQHSK